jgi:hypothetical protein
MLKKTITILFLAVVFILTSTSIAAACTIFTVSEGGVVLFGNNEDYINPNTYYWVEPAQDGYYGGVYFGFDNFWPQGGINEKGLSFDINSLPETPMIDHSELPYPDTYDGYSILRNCATVDEAIAHAQQFNWGPTMWGQIHVADATGDAVVMGPGPEGELAFTRKGTGDGYLISTNFNVADPAGQESECQRYQKTDELLKKVGVSEQLTHEYVKRVLDATHQESADTNTLYSTIYDLKRGTILIYYFHQFDEVVELSVEDELNNKPEPVLLSSLFSESIVQHAESVISKYRFLNTLGNILEILGIVALPVLAFFAFRFWRKRKKRLSAR